jgi:hypothetical protein
MGWSIKGITYGVDNWRPLRKQLVLYRKEGNSATPVAYFRNDAEAERFKRWLDTLGEATLHGTVRLEVKGADTFDRD